jgi:Tfp pilus assembly protein PilN
MLRTNLATRPFYNERLVHVGLGIALALIAAFTLFNVTRVIALSRAQAELSAAAGRDEARAADLTNKAAAIRRAIDPQALERLTAAANEANGLIDARAFSWTALFNDIEATLPPSVMLVSISQGTPQEGGGMTVQFVVNGRTVDAVDTFIERLEQTGRFRHVLAPSEQVNDDGLIGTTIVGEYHQATPAPKPPPSAAPASPARPPAVPPAGLSTGGGAR